MATLPQDVAGAEQFDGPIEIETPDYTDYELLQPGYYSNPSREVKVEQRTDKNGKPFVMARVEVAELLDKDGNSTRLRRPLVTYVFSFKRKERNHMGETSGIAKYLRACRVELGATPTFNDLRDALLESAAIPVKVRVDWTNRTPKVGEEYLPERAYTGDFKVGETFVPTITNFEGKTEKAATRLAEVMVEGVIKAKHKIGEFDRA